MTSSKRVLSTLCVAAAALGAGSAALAQSTSTTSPSSPYYAAGNSYVGVNVGRSDFSLNSGTGLFASEQRDNSYNFAAGTYFDRNFGVELGYTHFGNIQRGGGDTRAQGINLSAIGRLPLSTSFNLLGKLGTTYARTRVTSAPGSGISSGSENGFGLSLGLGAEYVFTPALSAVLQYELHDLKFAGGRDHVANTSIGLRYRF
ncbi:MAG TPA: outer membrane beta-barrel protein [Burkholderiaceae bacterium]|nr:outer membrane beta-barrel protein [Rhodoferax sp.]HQX61250.1 outer membrane beta-barrel protein [Burkholderiaceae bacterium]HQZ07722.1 outer membrane beta-barrel protein [Burkholderiaceae bacterium]HRA64116.1 outer membrane beta-barrel protein [Burkholderiaceae bacterium]